MTTQNFLVLPSIRKKILRSFFLLVFGFAILGTFLIVVLFVEGSRFSRSVLLVSSAVFMITVMFSLYVADGLATRLARSIKEMAERLKKRPLPGGSLKLPQPDSLEMRILTSEMDEMWTRLSRFNKLNVEELATQRRMLATVLESVEDAVLVLDPHGKIIHCNSGMMRLLGMREDDVVEKNWNDLSTADENYLKLRALLKPEMSKHKVISLVVSGEMRVYSGRYRDIRGAQPDAPWGVIYLLHDITEIRQRERMKSEFLGSLTKEFRHPLALLDQTCQMASSLTDAQGIELSVQLEKIRAGLRIFKEELGQLGLTEAHVLRLHMERVSLSQLVKNWITWYRVVAGEKNVRVIYDIFDGEEVWASVDVGKFNFVVVNLISEALRSSPPGSAITVRVSNARHLADLEVTGFGENAIDETKTDSLGLLIAREIVETHGGVMEPYQPSEGITCYRVTLPLAEPA